MSACELDRPMGKADRPRTTGQLMKSMRKLGDYDLDVDDADTSIEIGSAQEMELFDRLVVRGRGNSTFERAGPFWQMACLRARKYNVERAYVLVTNYIKWRDEFGVNRTTVDNDSEYRALVERGVVEACGNRDQDGHYVLTVRQCRTDPGRWSPRYAVLAAHVAIESLLVRFPEAQAKGVAFVNDMSGISMRNMDSRVPREMFAAFRDKLPVRFAGLYVVHPPMFMRMVAPVIKMFMSTKMQSRMRVLTHGYDDLKLHFDASQLPTDFGGSYPYSHEAYMTFVSEMQHHYNQQRSINGELFSDNKAPAEDSDSGKEPSICSAATTCSIHEAWMDFTIEPDNERFV
ncbi:uncharacterized protein MONBRDRAFT_36405 [Monosiga brevicollis MX1]|uniref:CRAL-TRIO domain-containing protein n=1 Tax=Monosiga brevicollis TaxID=81824 RepID=A9UUC1_MONBE|nr:uncharacterized protein MONBRDRAFT_36405 [Monosiga brevicollis MX1]EDQ91069.1 predicted protein [Monosiga brevicollis MX1]|eukprot:XP_001744366.1 hypothetical protein [Monosiga brevicollis MX1]